MCGKKLVEDEETPLRDLYSNFEFECDYPIFVFADRKMMNSVSFAVTVDFR